jgi:hypothetical protein
MIDTYPRSIFVRWDTATNDYQSDVVDVDVIEYAHMPGPHDGRSGMDFLFCKEGVFQRYDCYSVHSPYGWEKCTSLCHFGYVAAFEVFNALGS